MPSVVERLTPYRKAFLASALLLVIAMLLATMGPIPVNQAADLLITPGIFLVRAAGLPPGFLAAVLSCYANFAIYTVAFAIVFRLLKRA